MFFAGISVSAVDNMLLTADSRTGSSPFSIVSSTSPPHIMLPLSDHLSDAGESRVFMGTEFGERLHLLRHIFSLQQ
jgi:hypothetical protein